MSAVCAWMAEQTLRMPCGPQRAPDVVEQTAAYVTHARRVTYAIEVARHFDIDKSAAARRLRIAAERGLLERFEPEGKMRVVGYVSPGWRARG